jgi:hypothetical protein
MCANKPQERHLPANHDDKEANSGNGKCQSMRLVNIANDEPDLLYRAAMANARLVSQLSGQRQ